MTGLGLLEMMILFPSLGFYEDRRTKTLSKWSRIVFSSSGSNSSTKRKTYKKK